MTRYRTIFTMMPDGTAELTGPMNEALPFVPDPEALLVISFSYGPPDLLKDISIRVAYDLSLAEDDVMNDFRRHIDMGFAASSTGMAIISHKGVPRIHPMDNLISKGVREVKRPKKAQKKDIAKQDSLFDAEEYI
jgi:hypothetical protein